MALAGAVGVHDAFGAEDHAGGREIRARDDLDQILDGGIGVFDQVDDRIAQLGQVVRRDVGGHAHGDAGRAVEQQVRQLGGQHRRLAEGAIEVIAKIDGVFIDIEEQLLGNRREARLGIAHGRRRVAIDAAEVALAVDQRVAHIPGLRQARQRIVHRLRRRAGASCQAHRRRYGRTSCTAVLWRMPMSHIP